MSKKFVDKEQFFLLIEAGFVAIHQADEDSAKKIFKACELLNPTNMLPRIGMGYLHFHKLQLKQAAEIFSKILESEPSNEMAKTLLGMTLSMSPTKGGEGEKILTDICKNSDDPQIKRVADSAIDFVDKFVKKKSPSPLEPQIKEQKPKQK
ncbi:MAG: SctF chaperone SctG [Simkaniaceae bacterium]